ncbi:MAG: hypothetical protein IJ038_00520 [Clostridia bacterium]|nr:hypothetical protein [Clostridia bacterium]
MSIGYCYRYQSDEALYADGASRRRGLLPMAVSVELARSFPRRLQN